MEELYHKICETITDPPPAVFELVLTDHVPWVNPSDYGLDVTGINPNDYFITSGDAVEKAKILDRDLWQLAGFLRKELFRLLMEEHQCTQAKAQELFKNDIRPSSQPRLGEYEAEVWKAAGQSRKLINALKTAKGSNCFLETEWNNNHCLLCIPKNPRRP